MSPSFQEKESSVCFFSCLDTINVFILYRFGLGGEMYLVRAEGQKLLASTKSVTGNLYADCLGRNTETRFFRPQWQVCYRSRRLIEKPGQHKGGNKTKKSRGLYVSYN